jgi:hypothetical protein
MMQSLRTLACLVTDQPKDLRLLPASSPGHLWPGSQSNMLTRIILYC